MSLAPPSFLARPEYPDPAGGDLPLSFAAGGLNYGQALAMATLLMLICALALWIIERLPSPGL